MTERRSWQWVGADPDDMSEDARFRREVAALAREVMLARGADPATLPLSDGAPPVEQHGGLESPDGPDAADAPGVPGVAPSYFDIHGTAPRLLVEAARAVERAMGGSGSPTGVATTDLVLLTIARSPNGVTVKRLAVALTLPSSTVSTAVGRLTEQGLVVRRRSVRDRRQSLLRITDRGGMAAERAAAAWRQADDRLLDGLTVPERDELCRLLRRVVSALVPRPARR